MNLCYDKHELMTCSFVMSIQKCLKGENKEQKKDKRRGGITNEPCQFNCALIF